MKCLNCGRIGHFSHKCSYPKQEESDHEESCCHKGKKKFKDKRKNFYSKEESEDNEILFLGITNLDKESKVDIEAKYMTVVDEIERCRKRNKVLKEKLSKYQEETNHIITDLRNQLQEAKNSEEYLVVLLRKIIQDSEKLEKEIARLREGVYEKSIKSKFENISRILDDILNNQR